MHAIQVLPLLAWGMRRLGMPQLTRFRLVSLALWATCAFTIYSLLQTFTGRSRFDLWWLSAVALAITTLLFVGVLFHVAVGIGRVLTNNFRNRIPMQESDGQFDS